MTQDVRSDPGGLEPGEQLAGYLVQEEIGRGGMAVVYRAIDLRLDRPVALKVLAPHLGEDEAFRQRFMRESRAAAGVDHPHIIPVFEAGEAGGVLFIAMRYISRGDVRWLIRTEGRLTAARTMPIVGQIASALDAAHAYGLVHRDVKPGNILLGQASDDSDHAYLSDFGLSKHSLNTATLTAAGQFLGTLDYVSPEQIQGQPVDGRADQYALACTVMEMLTGAPPFRADDSMALMWAQLESEPPRLSKLRPDLPQAMDQVLGAAMAKSPAGRFPSCRDFAQALSAACLQASTSHWAGQSPARSQPPQAGEPRQAAELQQAAESGQPREPHRQPEQPHRQPEQPHRQLEQPDRQLERPERRAAFAGDATRRPEGPRPEAPRPEPPRPEPPRPESPRPEALRPEAWDPVWDAQADRPDRREPSANGDGSHRPGAGLAAAPLTADAGRPASGTRPPAAMTRWDGHVPAEIDRPRNAVAGGRPQPLVQAPADTAGFPRVAPWRSRRAQPGTKPHEPARTAQGRRGPGSPAGIGGRRRRGRDRVLAAVIAVVAVAILGGIGYKLAEHHAPPSPAAANNPAGASRALPANTVRAYFAAINQHRYLKAWELVGEQGSFQGFKNGFAGTALDTVRIVSVKGDVVTATLAAQQSDGTVKHYAGTYMVVNGIIVSAKVVELS